VLKLTLLVALLPAVVLMPINQLESELALDQPARELRALLIKHVLPHIALSLTTSAAIWM